MNFNSQKRIIRTLFFIIILSLVSVQLSYSKFLMIPYLQASTTNSVYVLAECDTKTPVKVEYGTTNNFGKVAETEFIVEARGKNSPSYVHRIKLTGLEPNTTYCYFARQEQETQPTSSFHTLVLPGTNYRFAIMGDCRSNPKVHSEIANDIKKAAPIFSVYGGDLCISGDYKAWKNEFFTEQEINLDASVPFFNTAGNHEGTGPNTKAFTQAPQSASKDQNFYSFDCGDVHFLILCTQISCKKGTPQYEFAKKDLESTNKKWKIVSFHEPAYVSGTGHGENSMMKAITSDIFEPNHVDVVIAGHSHFYQHNLVNGIHHFVIAGGGAPLYAPTKAKYTLKQAKDYNYGIADVTSDTLIINIYNLKGDVLDKQELRKK